MKRFWISWYTASEESPETSWRWWISGETCTDPTLFTVCAVIDAKDEAHAKAQALEAFPDAAVLHGNFHINGSKEGWRFCDEKPADWAPGDRFR